MLLYFVHIVQHTPHFLRSPPESGFVLQNTIMLSPVQLAIYEETDRQTQQLGVNVREIRGNDAVENSSSQSVELSRSVAVHALH